MSALASLERFGEKDTFFKNEDRADTLQSEWALSTVTFWERVDFLIIKTH